MINEDEELALGYLLDPAFELTNTAGKPLTDGWINVYVHGTRNKYYCYSDWNGNLHPFNIPLDGLGSNVVLASPQFTYDVYVYNRYGTLQMSRYNVSPVGVGEVSVSGINDITSSDGTVEVSQYGDTFDLSVPDITAVSGLVEDVTELTSAVSGLTVNVEELNTAVSGLTEDVEEINTVVSSIQEDIESLSSAVSAIQADYVTEEELSSAISAVSAMVPAAQVQSDWDEDDPSSKAYILNKPEEKDLVAGDGIEITVSGTSVIISSDNPSVSGYVTEQELASVSGTLQLEIDTVSSNPRVKIVEYGVDEWSDVVSAMDGVSSGKYDYVVMKYSANGTDLYAPLVKYIPGDSAYFVCPAHGTGNTYGYGERRTTEVFTINSGDLWFDRTIRPFQGRLYGYGSVSVTVQGEDYIVSGGSFEQVNADWNAVSGAAEILNKPTIPDPQVNSDWNAVSGVAQILNKPTIPDPQVNSDWEAVSGVAEILNKPETVEIETVGVSAGSGIAITEAASGIVISCTVTGGPGASYSAGSGIDITNDVISVDNTVALKTDIPTYTAGDNIDITNDVISVTDTGELIAGTNITIAHTGSDYVISSTGGGSSYSAGSGIDITNDVISVDNTVALKTDIVEYSAGEHISVSGDVISVTGISELVPGDNITITASGVSAIISASGGGVTYSAGSGIDITNDTISLDDPVNLVAGDNISISVSGASAVISSDAIAASQIASATVVASLPASPVSNVLYLIPEA